MAAGRSLRFSTRTEPRGPSGCKSTGDLAHASAHADLGTPSPAGMDSPSLREPHRLIDKGLDDVGLFHSLDHLAADEDLALAVARSDPEICLPRLSRSVDHATHHGNPERNLQPLQPSSYLVGELVDITPGHGRRTGKTRSPDAAAADSTIPRS